LKTTELGGAEPDDLHFDPRRLLTKRRGRNNSPTRVAGDQFPVRLKGRCLFVRARPGDRNVELLTVNVVDLRGQHDEAPSFDLE
jgi:hypothetical protein